jgi:hypothetical protein
MDYIKKNRLLIVIVAVLVILNLVTVSSILFLHKTPDPGLKGRRGSGAVTAFIERELEFSPEQKIQYLQLREEFLKKAGNILKEQHERKRSFFDLLKDKSNSQTEIRQKATEVGEDEIDLTMALFEHFQAVRALCTPTQQQKFDTILDQVLRMMHPSRSGRNQVKSPSSDSTRAD